MVEYVKTTSGKFLLKVSSDYRQFLDECVYDEGFVLYDGELFWTPNLYRVTGEKWKVVDAAEVPEEVQWRLRY